MASSMPGSQSITRRVGAMARLYPRSAMDDGRDPAPARDRFALPPEVYFAGNSLGPAAARRRATPWRRGWTSGRRSRSRAGGMPAGSTPPTRCGRRWRGSSVREPADVAVMNTLTVNLHLLLAALYRPTPERYRIVIDDDAFPSDSHAVQSHVAWHGLDPADAVVRDPGAIDEYDGAGAAGRRLVPDGRRRRHRRRHRRGARGRRAGRDRPRPRRRERAARPARRRRRRRRLVHLQVPERRAGRPGRDLRPPAPSRRPAAGGLVGRRRRRAVPDGARLRGRTGRRRLRTVDAAGAGAGAAAGVARDLRRGRHAGAARAVGAAHRRPRRATRGDRRLRAADPRRPCPARLPALRPRGGRARPGEPAAAGARRGVRLPRARRPAVRAGAADHDLRGVRASGGGARRRCCDEVRRPPRAGRRRDRRRAGGGADPRRLLARALRPRPVRGDRRRPGRARLPRRPTSSTGASMPAARGRSRSTTCSPPPRRCTPSCSSGTPPAATWRCSRPPGSGSPPWRRRRSPTWRWRSRSAPARAPPTGCSRPAPCRRGAAARPWPHLVVHGDADEHVPVAIGRAYAAAAPACTYVELPGCGHMEHLDPARRGVADGVRVDQRAAAIRHRISNSRFAAFVTVMVPTSSGGDTSDTSPPTTFRPVIAAQDHLRVAHREAARLEHGRARRLRRIESVDVVGDVGRAVADHPADLRDGRVAAHRVVLVVGDHAHARRPRRRRSRCRPRACRGGRSGRTARGSIRPSSTARRMVVACVTLRP